MCSDLPALTGGSGVGVSAVCMARVHCIPSGFSFLDFLLCTCSLFCSFLPYIVAAALQFSDSCGPEGKECRTRQEQGKLLRKHWRPGLGIQGRIHLSSFTDGRYQAQEGCLLGAEGRKRIFFNINICRNEDGLRNKALVEGLISSVSSTSICMAYQTCLERSLLSRNRRPACSSQD